MQSIAVEFATTVRNEPALLYSCSLIMVYIVVFLSHNCAKPSSRRVLRTGTLAVSISRPSSCLPGPITFPSTGPLKRTGFAGAETRAESEGGKLR